MKLQLATTEADIADATARINECRRLVRETENPETRQDVRKLQRTVEIELKGLEARRDSLTTYLDQISTSIRLNTALSRARVEERAAPDRPAAQLKRAITATRDLDHLTLQVLDDSVKIQPLKWEP